MQAVIQRYVFFRANTFMSGIGVCSSGRVAGGEVADWPRPSTPGSEESVRSHPSGSRGTRWCAFHHSRARHRAPLQPRGRLGVPPDLRVGGRPGATPAAPGSETTATRTRPALLGARARVFKSTTTVNDSNNCRMAATGSIGVSPLTLYLRMDQLHFLRSFGHPVDVLCLGTWVGCGRALQPDEHE